MQKHRKTQPLAVAGTVAVDDERDIEYHRVAWSIYAGLRTQKVDVVVVNWGCNSSKMKVTSAWHHGEQQRALG